MTRRRSFGAVREHVLAKQRRARADAGDRKAVRVATPDRAREQRAADQRRKAQRLIGLQHDEMRVLAGIEQRAPLAIGARGDRLPMHFGRAGRIKRRFEIGIGLVRRDRSRRRSGRAAARRRSRRGGAGAQCRAHRRRWRRRR